MTRRRNGTLTAAPEQTWKCCLVDDGGSRQRSLRRPPPRSMAVVRVPEFPGWLLLLLLLVSIVSGTRRMFVCCCFARWPLAVRPGLLIRPGPSPEARRSVCLVAFQARKPSTQDTSRVADQTRPDPLRQMVKLHDETWRNGDMDLKLNSSGESGRWSGGPCHVSDAPARRDISDRHVKRCGLEVEGRLQVIKSCASPDWHAHLCQFPTASLCRTAEAIRGIVHFEIDIFGEKWSLAELYVRVSPSP